MVVLRRLIASQDVQLLLVVTQSSVHKPSCIFCHRFHTRLLWLATLGAFTSGRGRELDANLILDRVFGLNRSNRHRCVVCQGMACLPEFATGVIVLERLPVGLHLGFMLTFVRINRTYQLCGRVEDLGPVFHSGQIVSNALAGKL